MLSNARAPDDAVFDLAVQFGIRRENVLVDGAEVMGCPVGTVEFIDRWKDAKVDDTVRDMAALKYSYTSRTCTGGRRCCSTA